MFTLTKYLYRNVLVLALLGVMLPLSFWAAKFGQNEANNMWEKAFPMLIENPWWVFIPAAFALGLPIMLLVKIFRPRW